MTSRLVALAMVTLFAIFAQAGAAEGPPATSQVPVAGMVTLVDLGAASCKPCKMMAPLLEELKGEYQGRAAVVFVDVRFDRPAVERFSLRAIPTQLFFDRSGREVYRHMGFLDKEAMTSILNRLIAEK